MSVFYFTVLKSAFGIVDIRCHEKRGTVLTESRHIHLPVLETKGRLRYALGRWSIPHAV